MKSKLLWVIVAVPLLGAVGYALYWYFRAPYLPPPSGAEEIAAVRKRGAKTADVAVMPTRSFDSSYRVRLAIGGLGSKNEEHNRQIGDLLTAELSSAKALELLERQSVDKILGELNLNISGLVRAKDAVRVGKLLRADWFLLGTVSTAGTSNILVARLVDARTGALVDATVCADQQNPSAVADELGRFVRETRQSNGKSLARTYLAVGSFQDFSVNSRQAEFPTRLRAYLTAAYRKDPKFTLLERESVNALLQEVRLDMAGLTENTSEGPPPPMQSAFWLVDGFYQSYETTNLQVELGMNIRRIFGRQTMVALRGVPNESLFQAAKAAIDSTFRTNSTVLVPTRTSEARAQLNIGIDLAEDPTRLFFNRGFAIDDQARQRRARNFREAMRAFETVLLLEPTNRIAKMYLAALHSTEIGDGTESLEYYRQLIEENVQDRWAGQAVQQLHSTLQMAGPQERVRWCESALAQSTNSSASNFFRGEARLGGRDLAIRSGHGSDVRQLAEEKLFERIKAFDTGRFYQSEIGMDQFVESFGPDRNGAITQLNELFPKMKETAPSSAPYLVATLVTFQTDTNAPIIGELEAILDRFAQQPKDIPQKMTPFASHLRGAYNWSLKNKLYTLSVKILESKFAAFALDPKSQFHTAEEEDKMALAFAYKAAERWTNALAIFQIYSNKPVYMPASGPWGKAFTIVQTSKQAALCREKLGVSPLRDSREFDMGEPALCLCSQGYASDAQFLLKKFGAFAATEDGLWIAVAGRLLHLDFSLKTNLTVALPVDAQVSITSLLLEPSHIWIATAGAGLVQFDKETRTCSRLTETDGLMMDFISAVELKNDILWLGYGQNSSGGLGQFDLKTRSARSFASSITAKTDNPNQNQPTRVPVLSLACGLNDDIWMIASSSLMRYRPGKNVWEPSPGHLPVSSLLTVNGKLFVGTGNHPSAYAPAARGLGVSTLELKDESWKSFPDVPGLPSGCVTALAADGRNIWIGGMGYIALIDPSRDQVLRFSYIPSVSVEQLQVAGGFLWAQFDHHLYRASLN